jgi:hypothetical protein
MPPPIIAVSGLGGTTTHVRAPRTANGEDPNIRFNKMGISVRL